MADEIPLPPADLSARLAHGQAVDTGRDRYLARGRHNREAIERILPEGWSWDGRAVLDFGCGAGRTIRHFAELAPECELWGCDIDPRCVEWNERHLSPPASFALNGELPPLPFEDGRFDLVYAMSVFTHIAVHWAAWLLELDRVLAPGGRLLASFMGEGMCRAVAGELWDERNIGMNVYEAGQPWAFGGPMVLHSPWWIEEHWGRLFEVERLVPRGFLDVGEEDQDDHGAVLLRKSASASPTAAELERIDSAEPREASALRHDVLHLRAEVAGLRAGQGR